MGMVCDSPNRNRDFEEIGREANRKKSCSFLRSSNLGINNNVIIGHSKLDPRDIYVQKELVGQGSFATVYSVNNKYTGTKCAMKVIQKEQEYSKEEEKEIVNEINILKTMDHPNILKIFEFYSDENEYSIITEFCKGGELFEEINLKGPFKEKYAAYVMYQIFSGINYFHNMNIIHRDIKPENILIMDRNDDDFPTVKICDFGTSKFIKKGSIQKQIVGSITYMAPEVINKNYNEKCDLWSCGIILYILLSKRVPFEGKDEHETIKYILRGNYNIKRRPFDRVSKSAIDLIQKLLVLDPKERISAAEALIHPWFIENKSKELYNEITDKKTIKSLIKNIKLYQRDSVIQEAALAYLVHNFPQTSDVINACKLFNQIDINGDGKITKKEFLIGLKNKIKTNNLERDVDEIYKNLDMDNNGFIEYEEFVRAAVNKEFFIGEDIIRFAFRYFDKDNSGEITFDEIEEVFKGSISKKYNVHDSLVKIIKEVDLNGDGKISFDEFAIAMRNMLTKKHQ